MIKGFTLSIDIHYTNINQSEKCRLEPYHHTRPEDLPKELKQALSVLGIQCQCLKDAIRSLDRKNFGADDWRALLPPFRAFIIRALREFARTARRSDFKRINARSRPVITRNGRSTRITGEFGFYKET